MTPRFIISESLEHVDVSTEWQYAVVDTTDNTVFCQCKFQSLGRDSVGFGLTGLSQSLTWHAKPLHGTKSTVSHRGGT